MVLVVCVVLLTGGATSLLALNGLFHLIHGYNLLVFFSHLCFTILLLSYACFSFL